MANEISFCTKEEHLAWAKLRAIKYAEEGNLDDAFSSLLSDLQKHPQTKDDPNCLSGMMLKMTGGLSTKN